MMSPYLALLFSLDVLHSLFLYVWQYVAILLYIKPLCRLYPPLSEPAGCVLSVCGQQPITWQQQPAVWHTSGLEQAHLSPCSDWSKGLASPWVSSLKLLLYPGSLLHHWSNIFFMFLQHITNKRSQILFEGRWCQSHVRIRGLCNRVQCWTDPGVTHDLQDKANVAGQTEPLGVAWTY